MDMSIFRILDQALRRFKAVKTFNLKGLKAKKSKFNRKYGNKWEYLYPEVKMFSRPS